MVNKVTLIGRIGKDVELKQFENGGKVASTTLATDDNYKDQNGEWKTITDWHNLSGRNKIADAMLARMQKGNMMYVEGKLKTRSWEGQDGVKKYITEVLVSYARVITKKEAVNVQQSAPPQPVPANNVQATTTASDDLPF